MAMQGASSEMAALEGDLRRFRNNLSRLIDHYGTREAARYSGFTEEGIRLIAKGERTPSIETATFIARSLGVETASLFLPEEQFARKLREGLKPFFVLRRPDTTRVVSASASSRSRGGSGRRAAPIAGPDSWLRKPDPTESDTRMTEPEAA